MTHKQVIDEVKQWPPDQKWLLLEALLHDLRPMAATVPTRATPRLSPQARLEIARRFHGSIRPSHGPVPTDDDVRQIIDEARMHKYA